MDLPHLARAYRILTVLQPHASFLMSTGELAKTMEAKVPSLAGKFPKDVENRGFAPGHGWRGTILIVAGTTPALAPLTRWRLNYDDFPFGVLGTVDLADVVENSGSPWAEPGRKHWLVTNPRRLNEPIPHKGFQGVRIPTVALVAEVQERLDMQDLTVQRTIPAQTTRIHVPGGVS